MPRGPRTESQKERRADRRADSKLNRRTINQHAYRQHGVYKFPEEMPIDLRLALHGDMHGGMAEELGLGEHTGTPPHTHENWDVPEEYCATD